MPDWKEWMLYGGNQTLEQKRFRAYRDRGGSLAFDQWRTQGGGSPKEKPTDWSKLYEQEFAPTNTEDYESALEAFRATQPDTDANKEIGGKVDHWDTKSIGGWDYQIGYDKDGNIVSQDPLGRTELPAGQVAPRVPYTQYGTNPYDNLSTPEVEGQFNPNTGEWESPAGYVSPYQREQDLWERKYQEQQMQLQQEQMAMEQTYRDQQLAAEKEARLAQLRANPTSWLEYASLSGQPAVVQPWMLPLMQGQYAGMQAGEAIPGWSAEASSLSSLPELLNPSSQYLARLSPTARAQYFGYEQARTGETPEGVSWRQGAEAAPSGSYRGLTRRRY